MCSAVSLGSVPPAEDIVLQQPACQFQLGKDIVAIHAVRETAPVIGHPVDLKLENGENKFPFEVRSETTVKTKV